MIQSPTLSNVVSLGDLVWVAGEMWEIHKAVGSTKQVWFTNAQLALVVAKPSDFGVLLWFPEFGTNKKKEHVLVRAPLGSETTKIWIAD